MKSSNYQNMLFYKKFSKEVSKLRVEAIILAKNAVQSPEKGQASSGTSRKGLKKLKLCIHGHFVLKKLAEKRFGSPFIRIVGIITKLGF